MNEGPWLHQDHRRQQQPVQVTGAALAAWPKGAPGLPFSGPSRGTGQVKMLGEENVAKSPNAKLQHGLNMAKLCVLFCETAEWNQFGEVSVNGFFAAKQCDHSCASSPKTVLPVGSTVK